MFALETGDFGKVVELCTAAIGLITAILSRIIKPTTAKDEQATVAKIDSLELPADEKEAFRTPLNAIRQALHRWKLIAGMLAGVLAVGAVAILLSVLARPSSDEVFWKVLSERDPETFYPTKGGHYEIARLIPDRPQLGRDTDFLKTLNETQQNLDVAVINGHKILTEYHNEIEAAIRNGVNVRIILFDAAVANQRNCDAIGVATGRTCTKIREESAETQTMLRNLRAKVEGDKTSFKGSLDVRLYPNVLLYTTWIKDGNDPKTSMALVRVHFYYDHEKWPSFIVSKDGKELIVNLLQEFNTIWSLSRPLEPNQDVASGG